MTFMILPHYKLLKYLPNFILEDVFWSCWSMARDLALYGKIDDLFLGQINEFPVDDLVTYGKFVEAEAHNAGIELGIYTIDTWLLPTNKQDARYRLTYKNCKRNGLKRQARTHFVTVETPFSMLYGTGLILNESQTYQFLTHLWTNNAISDYDWNKFKEGYYKLKEE